MSPANEATLMAQVAQMGLAITALKDEVAATKKEVHILTVSIIGDKIHKPEIVGVLDILKVHHTEMYGDEAIQHVGLKKKNDDLETRVAALESDRKWIYATSGGIGTGAFAVLWVIDWLAKR